MKKHNFILKNLLPSAILVLAIASCSSQMSQATIGVLSATSDDSQSVTTSLATEQSFAYQLAEQSRNNQLNLSYRPESPFQDEMQVTIRNMVEDSNSPAIGLVGATTNVSTTRVAALSNFFNVPMVIPSAIGDGLLPANNLWAFRLSAPGSAYATYLFDNVLTRQRLSEITNTNNFATPLTLGILYEQNTYGESTAVETAKAVMAQELAIGFYDYFDADAPDTERLLQSFKAMQLGKVNLLYIVSDNPATAIKIVSAIREYFPKDEVPILLGQSGAFTSQEFIQSAEASQIFIIRQQIVTERCPDGIETLTQAQSYAAISLLNFAMAEANDKLKVEKNPTLAMQRETLRDSLKATSFNAPCLGEISFDNTGQNKNLQFELLYAETGAPRIVSFEKLMEMIGTYINKDAFQ